MGRGTPPFVGYAIDSHPQVVGHRMIWLFALAEDGTLSEQVVSKTLHVTAGKTVYRFRPACRGMRCIRP